MIVQLGAVLAAELVAERSARRDERDASHHGVVASVPLAVSEVVKHGLGPRVQEARHPACLPGAPGRPQADARYGPRVDEQQPGADEPFDDDVYVRAWWQRSEHLHGENRSDEAAYALDWAETGIVWQMRHGDPVSAVSLLDRLLDAPGAVPEIVAHNLLQELVEDRGPEVEDDVARLCASETTWRTAVGFVVLTDDQRAGVPALVPYLGT